MSLFIIIKSTCLKNSLNTWWWFIFGHEFVGDKNDNNVHESFSSSSSSNDEENTITDINLADNTADTHREEPTLPCEQTFNNIDKILNLNSCEVRNFKSLLFLPLLSCKNGHFSKGHFSRVTNLKNYLSRRRSNENIRRNMNFHIFNFHNRGNVEWCR